MSDKSTAEPIKICYLMDFLVPDDYQDRDDLTNPFDMVFGEEQPHDR
jgi:branched-chain amino acid transport system substrate-binding protein